MKRPDVGAVLKELKDFQRKTVDYVYHRLYEEGADRFLIADEVGLGKTLVARGVIAKAIDRLWDTVDRIDIIYICSNADIARQNVNKLNITGNADAALASRITLLPQKLKTLSSNKVNFISFTPGTTLNMYFSTGIFQERVQIYHMLREAWDFGNRCGPKAVLRGYAGLDNWLNELDKDPPQVDPGLKKAFLDRLKQIGDIRTRFEDLALRSARCGENQSDELRSRQNQMIGELRKALAESCIHSLEPDIIILDEFQRFKDILDGDDSAAVLARTLFKYPNAKVILLSATPYKMYTMDFESEDNDHYSDFLRTVDFLLGDDTQAKQQLQQGLKQYRQELLRAGNDERTRLASVQDDIEQQLRRVMVRTERISLTSKQDGMLNEIRGLADVELTEADLHSFMLADKVANVLEVRDVVEYWKSAPYLLNVMDATGYKLKQELKIGLDDPALAPRLAAGLRSHPQALIKWDQVNSYETIDPGNARMRRLMTGVLENGAWKLLWMPAALPYYLPDKDPYAEVDCSAITKTLVFSSWQMVPKAIAMLTSYEAERRAVQLSGLDVSYSELRDKRAPLIRFALDDGRPTGMNYLTLLYPSPTLATELDPLALLGEHHFCVASTSEGELVSMAKAKVADLLEPIVNEFSVGDEADARWYWAAAALLDGQRHQEVVAEWLGSTDDGVAWASFARTTTKTDADGNFAEHIALLGTSLNEGIKLGKPPEDLYEVVAKIGLASPAVVSLRSLTRSIAGLGHLPLLLPAAAKVAMGYRTMFNLPETISLLRGLHSEEETRYWETVLDYCLHGNLQAVADEFAHFLGDAVGVKGLEVKEAIGQAADAMSNAVSLRTASLEFDELVEEEEGEGFKIKERRVRCRYGLRFGESKDDEDVAMRADQVRTAFNSPFRPFVLASTSLGQEGLDFHPYCHSIYHWNLPANPVDLEQREGRINRYKGHAVRKNVAMAAVRSGMPMATGDVWGEMFETARMSRPAEANDLIPYWLYESGDEGHRINRFVPALPLSRELGHMERLRNSTVSYRMVFGQPRQEDLLAFLESRYDSREQLQELAKCRIRLAPPEVAGGK